MKNNKAAGTRRELQVKRLLQAEGWLVIRAPASIGAADLIALRRGAIRLVQVKANLGGPYKTFGPKEREELKDAARIAGGVAELCHWPPRGTCNWIASGLWP